MEIASIPYYAHEGIVARLERRNAKLLAALIVTVAVLAVETTLLVRPEDEEEP